MSEVEEESQSDFITETQQDENLLSVRDHLSNP